MILNEEEIDKRYKRVLFSYQSQFMSEFGKFNRIRYWAYVEKINEEYKNKKLKNVSSELVLK